MKNNASAEERLLDLVRKSSDIFSQDSFLRKNLFSKVGRKLRRILRYVSDEARLSRVIVFMLAVSVVALFLFYVFPLLPVGKEIAAPDENMDKAWVITEDLNSHPLQLYLQEVRRNNIFGGSSQESSKLGALTDALKNMRLAGIVCEDPPQAIIKEKDTNNTYYLKKGETLGELRVVDILEGKIIIEYRGERFEMKL